MRKCIKKNIFVSELNAGNTRIEGLGVISPFFTSLLRTVRDEWRSAQKKKRRRRFPDWLFYPVVSSKSFTTILNNKEFIQQ